MKKALFFITVLCIGLFIYANESSLIPSRPSVEKGILREDSLSLAIRELSSEESEKYLQADLENMGYRAVQVSIDNQSKETYLFSKESIGLPLVDAKTVVKEILKASTIRSLGFKIAGLIFWPLGIPGTVDSLMALKNYNALKEKWLARAVREEVVPPYASFHRVFFIPLETDSSSFEVSLQNQETLETRVFQVEGEVLPRVDLLPLVQENYYLTHESDP